MRIHVGPLVTLPSSQKRPIIEHILGHGVQRPEITLSRITRLSGHFNEAVVETQIVANGVLPRRKFVFVVAKSVKRKVGELKWCPEMTFLVAINRYIFIKKNKPLHYKFADAAESQFLVRTLKNGHCDECDVGIGWFD